jgi:hypothetical protein
VSDSRDVPVTAPRDSVLRGTAHVLTAYAPLVAAIDIADTTSMTLARWRATFAPLVDSNRVRLSDLLLYRAGENPASELDSALALAVPGDTISRSKPLGIFWETYGLLGDGESLDVAVSVERVDHSWIRSTRQRLGLTPVDTPIRIHWNDARSPANRGAANAISLDLADLATGRYRITLSVMPVGGLAVLSSREIELTER